MFRLVFRKFMRPAGFSTGKEATRVAPAETALTGDAAHANQLRVAS